MLFPSLFSYLLLHRHVNALKKKYKEESFVRCFINSIGKLFAFLVFYFFRKKQKIKNNFFFSIFKDIFF
jgi:hypothetical protein